jgi:hypothetical protein
MKTTTNFIPFSSIFISNKPTVGMVDKLIMPTTIESALISNLKQN